MEFREPMTVVTGPNLKSPSAITVMPIALTKQIALKLPQESSFYPDCLFSTCEDELEGEEREREQKTNDARSAAPYPVWG